MATKAEQDAKRATRRRMHDELAWADRQVASILGVDREPGKHCLGCGAVLPALRKPGNPRKWCSETCRVRVAGRGSIMAAGFAGALLADRCGYCDERSAELDHIVPSGRGGDGSWENLAGVCRRCNSRKGDLKPLQFLLARPLLDSIESAKAGLSLLRAS